jgi:hypothetical protein
MLINEESLANVYEMSTYITCLGNIATSQQSYNWTITLSSDQIDGEEVIEVIGEEEVEIVKIVRIKPAFTSWESQLDV